MSPKYLQMTCDMPRIARIYSKQMYAQISKQLHTDYGLFRRNKMQSKFTGGNQMNQDGLEP